jgi:hypothetical protein
MSKKQATMENTVHDHVQCLDPKRTHPGIGIIGAPNRLIEIYYITCQKCRLNIFVGGDGLVRGGRGYTNTQAWCCAKCGTELFCECDSDTARSGDTDDEIDEKARHQGVPEFYLDIVHKKQGGD